jgi:tight adherence protein C
VTVFVALAFATAVTLLTAGLPLFGGARLGARIEPYLSGLHGRPSDLLVRPASERGGRLGARLSRALERIASPQRRLAERLAAAGASSDVGDFRLEQLTWAMAATIASWVVVTVAMLAGMDVDALVVGVLSLLAFFSGYLGRDWWLGRQIENRRGLLQEELPTALDLITLSIMSGESVAAAFARVARSLRSDVGTELERVVGDVRAGSSLLDALKQRVPLTSVGRFVDALVTGVERGAPLADVLRAQADDGRELRRKQLLEMGGRREVLMLVPVVFLIMPVVVAFTLLPGLVALDLLVP